MMPACSEMGRSVCVCVWWWGGGGGLNPVCTFEDEVDSMIFIAPRELEGSSKLLWLETHGEDSGRMVFIAPTGGFPQQNVPIIQRCADSSC